MPATQWRPRSVLASLVASPRRPVHCLLWAAARQPSLMPPAPEPDCSAQLTTWRQPTPPDDGAEGHRLCSFFASLFPLMMLVRWCDRRGFAYVQRWPRAAVVW